MFEAKLDVTDELLVAYVDNELDASQREMVGSMLATHPALSRRADEMRLARDLLCEAFPLRAEGPVPAPIEAAANRFADAWVQRSLQGDGTYRFRHWRMYAVAAGVVLCAAGSALYFFRRSGDESVADAVTALMRIHSGTPLYGVLESAASGQEIKVPTENAILHAVLTFRAKDGRFCREFEVVAGTRGATGIACRDRGEWRAEVVVSTAAAAANSDHYTPAGEHDEPAVAQLVGRLIQGDPLNAQDEAQLLANGWPEADTP